MPHTPLDQIDAMNVLERRLAMPLSTQSCRGSLFPIQLFFIAGSESTKLRSAIRNVVPKPNGN